ncbi:MAG: HAD family phosphatase [Erysipelotrichaceae bacterium]|nr:HAD family phosphatase [Erysipelotrichaceae bacterium]
MLKNIIFDMGRVLIEFDPLYFIRREGVTDPEETELLLHNVFQNPLWHNMDEGKLDEAEMCEKVRDIIPEHLYPIAVRLISRWWDPIVPVKGMKKFVKNCKEAGYGIYLLSNASVMQKTYWPSIPGSEYFDGGVVSAYELTVKPEKRIYEILLERYQLNAEECLFIDDLQRNIDGAVAVGIKGYLFDGDINKLTQYLFREKES